MECHRGLHGESQLGLDGARAEQAAADAQPRPIVARGVVFLQSLRHRDAHGAGHGGADAFAAADSRPSHLVSSAQHRAGHAGKFIC